jgi:hypothetical protein
LTVIFLVIRQPAGDVQVTIALPALTGVTTPVNSPIVATEALSILQVPPLIASVSADGLPMHRFVLPPIAPGTGYTVTVVIAEQPAAVV